MMYLSIGTFSAIIFCIILSYLADRYCNDGLGFVGIFFGAVACALLIIYGFFGVHWKSAEVKAHIINNEYGTKYSTSDVFYGSAVIDKIQQIKRQRIELNGNLMQGGK